MALVSVTKIKAQFDEATKHPSTRHGAIGAAGHGRLWTVAFPPIRFRRCHTPHSSEHEAAGSVFSLTDGKGARQGQSRRAAVSTPELLSDPLPVTARQEQAPKRWLLQNVDWVCRSPLHRSCSV